MEPRLIELWTVENSKFSQVAELVDAKLSRLEMPDSLESVKIYKGSIGDS
jgi:hypothetical protein